MNEVLNTPAFGLLLTIICFEIGLFINKKTKFSLFNPLLISQVLIISFLLKFNISFEAYNKGGEFISFFLGPATVILAVPLYKKMDLLKKNIIPVLVSIFLGSLLGIICVIFLSYTFGLDLTIIKSLSPKSVTAPIGIELSKQLKGMPSITVASIMITGIMGAIIAPSVCKLFGIKDSMSIGIAIGTSSHALGTTKAMELGETEGAMSSLSIGVAGLITTLIVPIIINIFERLL